MQEAKNMMQAAASMVGLPGSEDAHDVARAAVDLSQFATESMKGELRQAAYALCGAAMDFVYAFDPEFVMREDRR